MELVFFSESLISVALSMLVSVAAVSVAATLGFTQLQFDDSVLVTLQGTLSASH